jgi:hypothetical protein
MAFAYPETRYAPPELTDLTADATRKRLSPAALRTFFNIVEAWSVPAEDAMSLLGGVPSSTFYALKKSPRTLGVDALLRISYLIGIYKALHLLHSDELADRWVRLPNKNQIFKGATPLEYMIHGGIPAFEIVRRLLDARRGGA